MIVSAAAVQRSKPGRAPGRPKRSQPESPEKSGLFHPDGLSNQSSRSRYSRLLAGRKWAHLLVVSGRSHRLEQLERRHEGDALVLDEVAVDLGGCVPIQVADPLPDNLDADSPRQHEADERVTQAVKPEAIELRVLNQVTSPLEKLVLGVNNGMRPGEAPLAVPDLEPVLIEDRMKGGSDRHAEIGSPGLAPSPGEDPV